MGFEVNNVILAIFVFLGTLTPISSFAQWESNRIIKKYSIKDGLSQATVNSITQDPKGLLWFATDDGLNRFDGYSFTTLRFGVDSAEQIHDNFVQSVFKDSSGTLWVSSRKGLYKFDLSTLQLTQYLDEGLPTRNDVSYISEGRSGNLWIARYWGGFASFDRNTGAFTPYDEEVLPSLSSSATICLVEDSYGLLWVGSQDKGLNVFTGTREKILDRRDDLSAKDMLPSLYIKCIEEDHLGNVWIGTTKGLALFLRQENRFHVFPESHSLTDGKGVFALFEDSRKRLWIGTHGGGLYVLNLEGYDGSHPEALVPHHVEAVDQYNISQHNMQSIFEDRDNNIWVGSRGDGIYMIGSEEKKFFKIQTKKFVKSSESLVPYYGLCNDNEGFIWAGTDGEGIYKLKPNGDLVRHFTADGKPGSIGSNVIVSAFRDNEGKLWFGTYSDGLFLYDNHSDSFTHFAYSPFDAPVPLGNQVRLIFEDSKKNLWIGATRGGLCVVNQHDRTFRNVPGIDVLQTIDVRAMVEDSAGGLWVGCYGNGLNYYVPGTDQWIPYFGPSQSGNPLGSNIIYALALDQKNRLWIGTGGGGLSVYNTVKKSFKQYTTKHGLINNTIYGLLIDERGAIWMSTIKGISRFEPETEQFFNYTSFDGLQEGQFNPGSALYNSSKGYMSFGGALGLNVFRPLEVRDDSKVPEVMISGFQLFNKPVKVGKGDTDDDVLLKVIDETDKVTLRHDQSVFTFEFTALNYNNPEKNKYAYKLEGLDNEWNYVGLQRTATYRYLHPGSYEFKVKATSQDNVWPEEYASVKVVVLSPLWKTPMAYLIYFIVFASICYGIILVRRKQMSLGKRLRIEKAQRKRERLLIQEKLSFFTEISHEFRTPLTLMLAPLEEMLTREGSYTPVGKKLKMVYRNAHKLFNLINRLLDYRKAETGNMVLKVREDNIVEFVEEIFITFKELAVRKRIHFQYCPEQPTILTWFDKEKLEMVLNNILSNSFKYIGHGDAITIKVKEQDGADMKSNVVLEITDNGIGIPPEDLKYIFDWFYQANSANPASSGIGLALAKKLIYLHKGQISVESKPAKGSTFTIKIPIGREHFESHEIVIDDQDQRLLQPASPFLLTDRVDDDGNAHKKGLKSILIVEDDDDLRSFLKQYFERNYRIYESANGKEGLAAAMEHCPDLVISDIMMPEMNGIDFCKEIKMNIKTSHVPVVLLTAKTAFTHHREGLEIGADAYINKPFSVEMLALTINNLFQSREKLKRFYRNLFVTKGAKKNELLSPDEKLLQHIYELLKANLDKTHFNLDDVSEALTMSRSLLYKKIKALTGLSPVEYVRSLRLTEAAKLLRTHQYKVFEVVYLVGFSDIKYFRQCFTKEFGYPPSHLLESRRTLKLNKNSSIR